MQKVKNLSSDKNFLILTLLYILYCLFAIIINNISFLSIAFPMLLTMYLFTKNLKILKNKKVKYFYIIFFILNLFILAIDIKHNFLPLTHMDFGSFDYFAKIAINNSNKIFDIFKNSIDLFVFFVALLYKIFGSHPEMIAFYIFPFTLLIFKYMYKLVFEITNSNKISLLAAFIINFWPVNYLFGFSVLREIPNEFFVLLSFYSIIKYIKNNKLKNALLSLLFALICTLMHSGFIGLFCIYIYVILQKLIFKKIKIFNIPIIITIVLVLVIVMQTPLWPKIGQRFSAISSPNEIFKILQNQYNYLIANTTYVHFVPKNYLELAVYIPYRFIMYVFSPFIWQVYDKQTFIAFALDAIPRLIMTIYIIRLALIKNKDDNAREIFKITFLLLISTYFIFCLGVSNYGTAMRHRTKMLPIEISILIGYGYNFYKSKKLTKQE